MISLDKMRLVVILVLCVWSCQGVRDRNCLYPNIPDGFVVPNLDSYEDNSTAYYSCEEGKKTVLGSWWGEIKCVDGVWSPLPQCIDQSSCITPHVPNAEPQANLEKFYYTGAQVEFKCKEAYHFQNSTHSALCENGRWNLPVCERHQGACDPPARINNAVIKQKYKELYEEDETLEFACKPGYELKGPKISICWEKQWGRLPECVLKEDKPQNPSESGNRQPTGGSGSTGGTGRKPTTGGSGSAGGAGRQPTTGGSGSAGGAGHKPTAGVSGSDGVSPCGELPEIPHGTVSPQSNKRSLVVQCPQLYKLVGPNTIYCERGKWTALPSCKPPCVLDGKRFYFYYPNDKYLEEGVTKNYYCNTIEGWRSVNCVDGRAYSTCPIPY